ncbi:MAG: GTP cyclohydrolase I FolE [Sediminibacterium sp.]|nr:GTP cyclohydrolase I FolE [Sediminibacterium sp.]
MPLKKQNVNNKTSSISTEEKMKEIAAHFGAILTILGLDLNNDSIKNTPNRVAKMYVNEIFKGLDKNNFPSISVFKNDFKYNNMLIEKNIAVFSTCEHHFMPIIGTVSVAYFPEKNIIGLSKIHRIVHFFSRKPQVQERLTNEIGESLQKILQTNNVAVKIQAKHLCIAARGIEDLDSYTSTFFWGGNFEKTEIKNQFLTNIN